MGKPSHIFTAHLLDRKMFLLMGLNSKFLTFLTRVADGWLNPYTDTRIPSPRWYVHLVLCFIGSHFYVYINYLFETARHNLK